MVAKILSAAEIGCACAAGGARKDSVYRKPLCQYVGILLIHTPDGRLIERAEMIHTGKNGILRRYGKLTEQPRRTASHETDINIGEILAPRKSERTSGKGEKYRSP